ncbi:MAG: Zeta toxin family protein [Candidatus Electrothrix sp. EH2]|nr:Zeta toxin family protein [Candidatus Electrothrix sp. EH2]
MSNSYPYIFVIAGPNGAGKSTCGPAVLQNHFHVSEFVNADIIAAGLSAFHPENAAIEAGRIMLRRLRNLAEKRVSFAFETTLASRTFAPWISRLKDDGYQIVILFFWLHSPDLAVARVAERVRLGGHSVQEETVRRRYSNSIQNFFNLYQKLADNWCVIDNSVKSDPVTVAEGQRLNNTIIYQHVLWEKIISVCNEKR